MLTHPNIKIPSKGKIYSLNEANYFDWDPKLQAYVNQLKKVLQTHRDRGGD